MKTLNYLILFVVLTIACSKKNEAPIKVESGSKDSVALQSDTISKEDDECIFDNNPKELTAECIKEAGFEKFTWDSQNNKAIVIHNQDTLLVYKGGCIHLVSSIEIRTPNTYNDLFDSRQMQKINDLACRFKFETYCGKILNNQYDRIETDNEGFILEFEDDENKPENLISEGIEIKPVKNNIHIKISEYYN